MSLLRKRKCPKRGCDCHCFDCKAIRAGRATMGHCGKHRRECHARCP